MATFNSIRRLEIKPIDDPNRVGVLADLVSSVPPPSGGTINVTAVIQVWVGDDPTWTQLQLRVLDAVGHSFELPDELRSRLGAVYASDQTRSEASPSTE